MNLKTQNIKSFFYKYWWLYYLLFFFLLGLLIYALIYSNNWNEAKNRITIIDQRLEDCCKARQAYVNDSIRVVENKGEFGCLSFTLVWNSSDDLDLEVLDAKNNYIFFKKYCKSFDNEFSSAGGQLDIDLNAENVDTDQPVENVFFKCTPPNGIYSARVRVYEKRDPNPTNIKLIVRRNATIIKEITTRVKDNKELVELIKYNFNANE
jgi:hypothetical protein